MCKERVDDITESPTTMGIDKAANHLHQYDKPLQFFQRSHRPSRRTDVENNGTSEMIIGNKKRHSNNH